jgi:hypothetical protein
MMLRSLVEVMPSKQTPVRTRLAGGLPLRRLIGAACVLHFARRLVRKTASSLQTISITRKANHVVPLGAHGNHNATNCAPEEPPIIDLEVPPSHGVLCVRREEYHARQVYTSDSEHCKGRKVSGVRVLYRPHHAYTGVDTFRYAVRSPRLGPMRINFNLTLVPDTPQSRNAVPADISAPANDTPQSPGPIPACAALVS